MHHLTNIPNGYLFLRPRTDLYPFIDIRSYIEY